jgi:ABC-2 type transport system permease protein
MTVFLTTIKRILGQQINWLFILLFPVLCFILVSLTTISEDETQASAVSMSLSLGVADNDNTVLSKTLANQLGLRYNIIEVDETEIAANLTQQNFPWILLIKEGYEQDILAGNTALTTLEGYSLTVSDASALGSAAAEAITRSLMILGTNDEAVISEWQESSQITVEIAKVNDNWRAISQWLSMFGFISILTAYFVIKTLLDDKKHGMPDRVGILPLSSRKYLLQGTLAAFIATEIAVALTLVALWLALGTIPNVLLMFLLLSLFNLFAVSLVLSITSIAKSLASASVAMTMIATLLSMLGGLFWPLEIVPDIMKKIAWFTPGYWFGEGLQNVREPSLENFGIPLLFLFGFTVVTLLIGGMKKVQKMED